MRKFDNLYRSESVTLLAGVDEVGRGPLAGPVVAAAVIFPVDVIIHGVRDSKILTEEKREQLVTKILHKAIACSVAAVSHKEIDRINILNASLLAMSLAVQRLKVQPQLIIADGNKGFAYAVPVIPVIKGDAKSFSVAAASILAKVARDRLMKRLSTRYPCYLWSKNKGYPTKEHIAAIKKYGTCVFHRRSFLNKILCQDSCAELIFEKGFNKY